MSERQELISSAFNRAADLCSRVEKSPQAIQKKLQLWELTSEECETVMQRLFEQRFLDEQRFANFYVRDKYRFNRWGRIKIAYQLKHEGISPNCIQSAMEEIKEEEYLENLRYLLEEKLRKTKAKDAYDLKVKVVRHAQSRGFEPDLIFREWAAISRQERR
ncbi:MAG: regulatory protein RecX [Mangrovibacterium sp.]